MWLDLPKVVQVGKKLGVEVVPAVVGFERQKGFSVPLLKGGVIFKKDKQALIEAWQEMMEKQEEREREKEHKKKD